MIHNYSTNFLRKDRGTLLGEEWLSHIHKHKPCSETRRGIYVTVATPPNFLRRNGTLKVKQGQRKEGHHLEQLYCTGQLLVTFTVCIYEQKRTMTMQHTEGQTDKHCTSAASMAGMISAGTARDILSHTESAITESSGQSSRQEPLSSVSSLPHSAAFPDTWPPPPPLLTSS